MGIVRADLSMSNPLKPDLRSLEVSALVDTGALHLCIPEHVVIQMGYDLDQMEEREVTTADGKKHLCPYVGPVKLSFKNRSCYVGALVLGDEVLLGAVPMEDMDLVVIPAKRMVDVNPDSPNIPSALVKVSKLVYAGAFNYPGYEIRKIGSTNYPVSKKDGSDANNLG